MEQAKKTMNITRLAIYQCYDKSGWIDDYIVYFLRDLMENITDLVVTVNGILSPQGRQRLSEFTEEIFVRGDDGFDAGAWKDTMIDYLGWERLSNYDELILINDSFYGPLYPLSEVFSEMENRSVDFWGITAYPETNTMLDLCPYSHMPAHIQCYFTVFHKKLHTSKEFQKYWEALPCFQNAWEATCKNEVVLTKFFSDLGYSWDVFVSTADLDGTYPDNYPVFHIWYNIYNLIKNRRCSIIKRHCFAFDYDLHLTYTNGMQLRKALEYIRDNTKYDLSLVYKNLLRMYNIADIFTNLHLQFVFPKHELQSTDEVDYRAILVFHVSYLSMMENICSYIKELPSYIDVIITTKPEEKKDEVESFFLPYLGNRLRVLTAKDPGREFSAFLMTAASYLKEYDYIGFCHDKGPHVGEPITIAAGFLENILENVLGSGAYVENVLHFLHTHPEMGFLCPPHPNHGPWKEPIPHHGWGSDFSITKALAERLELNAILSEDKLTLALGNAYWCRREALLPLLEYPWKYEDFPPEPMPADGTLSHALERIFPFVAQSQGFLSGWMMTDEYASLEINNLFYERNQIDETAQQQINALQQHINSLQQQIERSREIPPEVIERIEKQGVSRFVKKLCPKPFWGVARRVKRLLGW